MLTDTRKEAQSRWNYNTHEMEKMLNRKVDEEKTDSNDDYNLE